MSPYLIDLPGGYSLESYWSLYITSALVFAVGAWWSARRRRLSSARMMDLAALYVLAMGTGAALAYDVAAEEWTFRALTPWGVREGGLVGGPGIFLVLLSLYVPLTRAPVAALDVGTLALPAALATAKVGCLLLGCCHGHETASPFSLVFPDGAAAPEGVPLHPTQIYDAIGLLATLGVLVVLAEGGRRPAGSLPLWFTLVFSVGRCLTEFLRGDESMMALGLRATQVVLIAGGAFALALLLWRRPWRAYLRWCRRRWERRLKRPAPGHIARPRQRMVAGLVDGALTGVIALTWHVAGGWWVIGALVGYGLLTGLVPAVWGASPGQLAAGLALVTARGRRARTRAILRALLGLVSWNSAFGMARMAVGRRRQGLHDVLSGTFVVVTKPPEGRTGRATKSPFV